MWAVQWHPNAEEELTKLPANERVAVLRAVDKLVLLGPTLPYPHQSAIRAGDGLRELRPRGGRSPWRALYDRSGDTFIIAAVGPEADVNPKGFTRAVRMARERLNEGK